MQPNANGWTDGWYIEVTPEAPQSAGGQDYVWVVTPPYHSRNPRYVDTEYGVKAQDVVAWTPRSFKFVLNGRDYEAAAAAVEKILHGTAPADEQQGLDALAGIPTGTGKLSILDSRLAGPSAQDELGAVEWMKFEVDMCLPCGFPVRDDPGVDRSHCKSTPGETLRK